MGKSALTLFVPFNPDPAHHWLVRRQLTEIGRYPSQDEAVRAAFEYLRRQLRGMSDTDAEVRVQSEDGSWASLSTPPVE